MSANNITKFGATPIEVFNFPKFPNCGHTPLVARHVAAVGGSACYVCRRCYQELTRVEAHTACRDTVRAELANLFRNSWPGGITPRAFTPIGGERRAA